MFYSAILVMFEPPLSPACSARLDALPGVEVFRRDPPTGRLIAVLESDTLDAQRDTLQRIQLLPGVLLAELVYQYLDRASPDRVANIGRVDP